MTTEMPRPEYPRPQFRQADWLCLNGPWQFEVDAGDSGLERGLAHRKLAGTITVPFCPDLPDVRSGPAFTAGRRRDQNWIGRQSQPHPLDTPPRSG